LRPVFGRVQKIAKSVYLFLSVRMEQTRLPLDWYLRNFIFEDFSKFHWENSRWF